MNKNDISTRWSSCINDTFHGEVETKLESRFSPVHLPIYVLIRYVAVRAAITEFSESSKCSKSTQHGNESLKKKIHAKHNAWRWPIAGVAWPRRISHETRLWHTRDRHKILDLMKYPRPDIGAGKYRMVAAHNTVCTPKHGTQTYGHFDSFCLSNTKKCN